MGQSASSHSGHRTRRPSLKLTFSSMGKRKCNNSKNLSHTFSFPDETLKIEQLNVNVATEEELMTLPGISRNLASNIVSHRQMIGRFNRVEDLALVSGVGAHKLELFKLEVYVPSASASGTSSRASISMDSVGNSETVVDVNGASIFALQGVPGVNQLTMALCSEVGGSSTSPHSNHQFRPFLQVAPNKLRTTKNAKLFQRNMNLKSLAELASKIVERRLKHGPYRSLDELAKLGGMGKHRFAMIKPYLKINGISNGSVTPTPSNGSSLPSWNGPQAASTPKVNNLSRHPARSHRSRTTPSKIYWNDEEKSVEFNAGISEDEIWELLSVASPRPSIYPEFTGDAFSRSSIRLASWNLTSFNCDKASNPGVMEVICRTILENRLSLLALQEVKSPEALEKLTRELNAPSLKRVRDWRENRRSWRSIHLGAGLAVIWDSNPDKCITLKEQPPATTVLLPVLASCLFKVNKVDLTLINIHMHDTEDNRIIERFTETKNAIFLGDFTLADDSRSNYNEVLHESNTAVYTERFLYKDKIIWGRGSKKLFNTDVAQVVRLGLTHLGIPYGWRWGGPASNHCPIWCEIFTEPVEV